MSVPRNKYAALEALLRSMFGDTELRAFIHRLPAADRLVASLPGATASLMKVVFDAIGLLNRHGLIDSDFFEALAQERPRKRSDIAEVALAWGVRLPASVVPSQPDAPVARGPGTASDGPSFAESMKGSSTQRPSPPSSPESWDVFVSYAHEDQEWVQLLVENLHELGLEVFYDGWEVDYGDTVSLRLSDGLRRSRNGVLVVSPTALSRPWVLEEYASLLEGAVQRGQRLIPVLYRDAEMPAMLSTRRWVDLRDKRGEPYLAAVRELAAALKGERPQRPKRGQGLRAPGSSVAVPMSAEKQMPTSSLGSPPEPTIQSAKVVAATQGRLVRIEERRAESPPIAAYRWLHLSDLHVGCRGEAEWIQMVDDFERSLDAWMPRIGVPDLVLLTGDLTNRGRREEFDRLDVFLERLQARLERFSDNGARPLVIPVPGNHDLQRPSEDDLLDNYAAYERYVVEDDRTGRRLHKRLWEAAKGEEKTDRVRELFAEYTGWLDRTIVPSLKARASEIKLHTSFFPGDLSLVVELAGPGFPLALVGLNSSWLQIQGGDHEGKLALPLAQFHAALPDDSPLDLFRKDRVHRALLMMHHPPTWLAERFEEEFLRGVYRPDRFAICLHGHMHQPTSRRVAVDGGEERLFFQAPSLFGLEHYGTSKASRLFGYAFGELRENGEVRAWPLDRVVKGDGITEFVADHRRWRWQDTPAGEPVAYRQHVQLRPGDGLRWLRS